MCSSRFRRDMSCIHSSLAAWETDRMLYPASRRACSELLLRFAVGGAKATSGSRLPPSRSDVASASAPPT